MLEAAVWRRRGCSSGARLRSCSSGRPWWRGEGSVVVGILLLVLLVVVVFVDSAAPAGLGGEGGGGCRCWCDGGGGRRRRCEAVTAGWCGVLVVDLTTSGEVVRRRPGSRAEVAWGVPPADGRHSSSDPARRSWWLMRLINAFGQGAPLLHGCELWAVAFSLVSGDGGRPCWSSSWLKTASCSSDDLCILLVLFFACIRLCNPPFYI